MGDDISAWGKDSHSEIANKLGQSNSSSTSRKERIVSSFDELSTDPKSEEYIPFKGNTYTEEDDLTDKSREKSRKSSTWLNVETPNSEQGEDNSNPTKGLFKVQKQDSEKSSSWINDEPCQSKKVLFGRVKKALEKLDNEEPAEVASLYDRFCAYVIDCSLWYLIVYTIVCCFIGVCGGDINGIGQMSLIAFLICEMVFHDYIPSIGRKLMGLEMKFNQKLYDQNYPSNQRRSRPKPEGTRSIFRTVTILLLPFSIACALMNKKRMMFHDLPCGFVTTYSSKPLTRFFIRATILSLIIALVLFLSIHQ